MIVRSKQITIWVLLLSIGLDSTDAWQNAASLAIGVSATRIQSAPMEVVSPLQKSSLNQSSRSSHCSTRRFAKKQTATGDDSLPVSLPKSKRPVSAAATSASGNGAAFQNSKRLNQLIVGCQDAKELLSILQKTPKALTGRAGGGAMNTVNFSTSLHRLARHSTADRSARAAILADARFALLLSSLAESMIDEQYYKFKSREFSNIGWALAKLQVAPPDSVMTVSSKMDKELLRTGAAAVREAVMTVAAARQQQHHQDRSATGENASWIPATSQLAGHLLDYIGAAILNAFDDEKSRLHPKNFEMQEYANLLWAWATAHRACPSVFEAVICAMIEKQKQQSLADISPQEWSNSVWAFATAQVYNGHEELLAHLATMLQTHDGFMDRFKPQELSNTMWGVATLLSNKVEPLTKIEQKSALTILRCGAESLLNRVFFFKTQELSNTAWAMATLGFGLKPSNDLVLNNYLVLPSDSLQDDNRLMNMALNAIVQAAEKKLDKFRSQELNNMAWSLARLVEDKSDVVETLLQGIGMQLANNRRSVTSQDIGTTLWSLATLEYFDPDIYRGIASRLTPEQAPRFKPQELSNSLWAMATADIEIVGKDAFDVSLVPRGLRPKVTDPIAISFGIAAQELMRRPQQFKPQEIKDVLWSFSKLGIRHPALFKSVAEHLVGSEESLYKGGRGLDEFSPQGLGNMAWAYARQAQLAEETSERLKGTSQSTMNNGRLGVYTTSFFDVGEGLLHALFANIADVYVRVHDNLRNGKPQDLANTAWAFAVLGLKDEKFMNAANKQLIERATGFVSGQENSMTSFKGQELANLLWALATVNMPAGNILQNLGSYLEIVCKNPKGQISATSIARVFKRQELANIAWACAVFGRYPADLMRLLYRGLIGFDREQDATYMAKAFQDGGMQSQVIMTLIYVQAAMDLEQSGIGVDLPYDFPDGWRQTTSPSKHPDFTEQNFELNLSTSKIQRAVSSAFSRVGLDHVEEHVITMAELAEIYGVKVPPKDLEVLSIDIADVKNKIAIEVDGPSHFACRICVDDDNAKTGYAKILNGKLEYQFAWDGSTQEMNGPTALKDRLLKLLGWRTIHVPFWEWYQVSGEDIAEEEYCRSLLSKLM